MRADRDAGQWARVGAAVGQRMAALDITVSELARKAALSAPTVRGVLRGAGRRQRWTLDALSGALGWPCGYLTAIAEDSAPPAPPEPERTPAPAAALPPDLQAAPFAVLLSLADLGHGASLQAESNAMAARLASEISQGMTPAERIAVHEFLTRVADKIRWPRS